MRFSESRRWPLALAAILLLFDSVYTFIYVFDNPFTIQVFLIFVLVTMAPTYRRLKRGFSFTTWMTFSFLFLYPIFVTIKNFGFDRIGVVAHFYLIFAFICLAHPLTESSAEKAIFFARIIVYYFLINFLSAAFVELFSPSLDFRGFRWGGITNSPSGFGFTCMVGLFASFFLLKVLDKKIYFVFMILALVSIILSGSRAAILGLALFLLILAVSRPLLASKLLVTSLIPLVLSLDYLKNMVVRFLRLGSEVGFDTVRAEIFSRYLDSIFSSLPRLMLGGGTGSAKDAIGNSVHNDWLRLLFDNGLLWTIWFSLFIFFYLFRKFRVGGRANFGLGLLLAIFIFSNTWTIFASIDTLAISVPAILFAILISFYYRVKHVVQ